MIILGVFVIIYFIGHSFYILEEETLVIIAGIFWLDAAGRFFKSYVLEELEYRGDVIKTKYIDLFLEEMLLTEKLIEKFKEKVEVRIKIKLLFVTALYYTVENVILSIENKYIMSLNQRLSFYIDIYYILVVELLVLGGLFFVNNKQFLGIEDLTMYEDLIDEKIIEVI